MPVLLRGLPAITSGPKPNGVFTPGRYIPSKPESEPLPTVITSLPRPASTLTGTVLLVVSTVIESSPSLPLTTILTISASSAGDAYCTCWVAHGPMQT